MRKARFLLRQGDDRRIQGGGGHRGIYLKYNGASIGPSGEERQNRVEPLGQGSFGQGYQSLDVTGCT